MRPPRGPRSRSQPGRPSTAVTPAASATRTATCGRSPGTLALPSGWTARSSCPISARPGELETRQLPDVGDAQHGRTGLIRRVQVDDRADAPVVVARRVVE